MGAPRTPPEARFWTKVPSRPEGECWPWEAGVKGPGYGVFYDGSRLTGAHQFSLRLKLKRDLLSGEVARHTCDNPVCVNPDHLVVGTQKQNQEDKVLRGRHHNQVKQKCPRGHFYDSEIKRASGRVSRRCNRCRREGFCT